MCTLWWSLTGMNNERRISKFIVKIRKCCSCPAPLFWKTCRCIDWGSCLFTKYQRCYQTMSSSLETEFWLTFTYVSLWNTLQPASGSCKPSRNHANFFAHSFFLCGHWPQTHHTQTIELGYMQATHSVLWCVTTPLNHQCITCVSQAATMNSWHLSCARLTSWVEIQSQHKHQFNWIK